MMSLHPHLKWYDTACFGIVTAAVVASLWLLLQQQRQKRSYDQYRYQYWYQSLMISPWCRLHPLLLLLFRLTAAALLTATLMWDLHKYDPSIFLYYTEWTFVLVIIYFLLGTLISAHACWLYSRQHTSHDLGDANASTSTLRHALLNTDTRPNPASPLASSMQIIYQTCAGAVILTDVVFWCLLVPFMSSAHFNVNLLMGCMHSLNLMFLLVDTFLNSMPFPWFGITYFILWSCTYVIFQWILHACGFSWWPYPFLELATPWAPLWYFCMAVIHVPCYGIYWLIVKAKNTYLPGLFPHS